ncbi:response regulator transcription factor [Alishewanella sp. SMS8]|uniref:helix-turn-helix transcriptional regulator n=1 Tax=unclassified Alishewanella TaxID=2628974 RepID=UPI002741E073|nr:response regulator transcription factor [Alishewanella sp. SMS8]MDP4946442.1 response regulator transcription factor [Alishewanella sp.]MDP5036034.1 response regulator transcription factor [Alishewanella sp.]MDP5187365.1 response regulator transcription factor [Alishewanella sp.]MDP5459805.1 response regulator transcription factor [Alishewanella sp. SMS8]
MANVAIFTAPGFTASSWNTAFGKPQLHVYPDADIQALDACDVVLIHSARSDWTMLVKQLQQSKLVLVISQQLALVELQVALSSGAKGYLDAGSNSVNFIQAVAAIRNGALWIPAALLNQLNRFLSKAIPSKTTWQTFEGQLSKREFEVASLVRQGLSNKQVAERLFITERTVKQHLTATFAKLGVKDRLQLIMLL